MENPSSSSSSSSSPSPNSSTSSSNSSNNGVVGVRASLPPAPPPPLTPKPSSIPPPHSSSPYPTTFVQADAQSFKQMVQLLTGSAEATAAKRQSAQPKNPIPPLNRSSTRKPAFKLHERRPSMKNLMMISPFDLSGPTTMNRNPPSSARTPLSPSVLDFPSLALSPVTPLIPDPFDRVPNPNPNPNPDAAAAAEERAIAEKGFYLHPSPRPAAPTDAEPPRLLPLFPVTSPRGSSA